MRTDYHSLMEKKVLAIRLNDALGCTVIASAPLQSLKKRFPRTRLDVYTKYPDLLENLPDINRIYDTEKKESASYDVDLRNYLHKRNVGKNKPFRHLYIHMIELAEEQLGTRLGRDSLPKINLTAGELKKAREIVREFKKKGKLLIWTQSRTSTEAKDWPGEKWEELAERTKDTIVFLDLHKNRLPRRIAVAATAVCDGGLVLDTFLLHGSNAAGAKNVVALLPISNPEVVTYENQEYLHGKEITVDNVVKKLKNVLVF